MRACWGKGVERGAPGFQEVDQRALRSSRAHCVPLRRKRHKLMKVWQQRGSIRVGIKWGGKKKQGILI